MTQDDGGNVLAKYTFLLLLSLLFILYIPVIKVPNDEGFEKMATTSIIQADSGKCER